MSEEQTPKAEPAESAESAVVEVQQPEARPAEPQAQDPRRRLRELLAIPERDRSDAIWDEIIGLEIDMAQGGNRPPSPQGDGSRRQEQGRRQDQQGRRPEQQQQRRQEPGGGRQKPAARFFKKPRRGPPGPPKG